MNLANSVPQPLRLPEMKAAMLLLFAISISGLCFADLITDEAREHTLQPVHAIRGSETFEIQTKLDIDQIRVVAQRAFGSEWKDDPRGVFDSPKVLAAYIPHLRRRGFKFRGFFQLKSNAQLGVWVEFKLIENPDGVQVLSITLNDIRKLAEQPLRRSDK